MKHLDLFSGIGGFSLAAQWVWGDEHEIIAFCEIDKFCQKVLNKHWPDVEIIEDAKDTRTIADVCNGEVDLLTGGFPCQPFSVAGKQKGKEDDRHLWPYLIEIVKAVRPTWCLFENVTGIINLALDQVLSEMEEADYSCTTVIIPACGVNAPHRRDRVWIIAHTHNEGESEQPLDDRKEQRVVSNSTGKRRCSRNTKRENAEYVRELQGSKRGYTRAMENWNIEPSVGRVAHGVSNRVDRLKGLGNAIVPQVAAVIMQAIKEVDNNG